MRALLLSLLGFSLLAGFAPMKVTGADSAPLFILKHTSSGYEIEKLIIPAGDSINISTAIDEGFVDIILPVGTGGSGNMVQAGATKSVTAAFDGQTITCTNHMSDGRNLKTPPADLEDLLHYNCHLSVTGSDGSTAAFAIKSYTDFMQDNVGPVMDMFRGMVPMKPGDHSILLNTESNRRKYSFTGEIPVYFSGKYLFTEATLPTGKKGMFAVDIGASVNLLAESFLPDNHELSDVYMIEYSSGQQRKLKYSPGGGTGPVESIIGQATIDYMNIGGIRYDSVVVDVIKSLPELHGRKIDGIIGLDLLKGARYLTLVYDKNDSSGSRLIISNDPPVYKNPLQLPFVSIRKLMYVKGQIKNHDVCFILDSGSPVCMLTPAGASALGVNLIAAEDMTFKGGGGQIATGQKGKIESISLKDQTFKDVNCVIGELFNLSMLSKGQYGGILGNSFFARFRSITFDFDTDSVTLAL